jgi:hypothetical protein
MFGIAAQDVRRLIPDTTQLFPSIYPDLLASFDFTPVAFFSPRYIFIYFSIHRGRRRRRRAILFIGEEKISDSE